VARLASEPAHEHSGGGFSGACANLVARRASKTAHERSGGDVPRHAPFPGSGPVIRNRSGYITRGSDWPWMGRAVAQVPGKHILLTNRDAMRCKTPIFGLLLCPALIWAEPATQTLQGRLVIPPEAGTKSSYFVGDFQLLTRDARLILTPSRQVSDQQLAAFKGKFVSIQAIYVAEQKPNPDEQAPMKLGPDGQPVLQAHPAHYQVIDVKVYVGKTWPVFQP
jgi:hypothetical protein